jgi:hypothetical protein
MYWVAQNNDQWTDRKSNSKSKECFLQLLREACLEMEESPFVSLVIVRTGILQCGNSILVDMSRRKVGPT